MPPFDQTSFLLAPDGVSCRKYHYYWLVDTFSALRVGEYKWMLSSTTDDATDVHGAGGFTGVTQRYTYSRLFNLSGPVEVRGGRSSARPLGVLGSVT